MDKGAYPQRMPQHSLGYVPEKMPQMLRHCFNGKKGVRFPAVHDSWEKSKIPWKTVKMATKHTNTQIKKKMFFNPQKRKFYFIF